MIIVIFLGFVSRVVGVDSPFEYDANGSLVSGDGKFYEYNDANQLVRVRIGDAAGAVLGEYSYDYTGQRIKKVENGLKTYYLGTHYDTQAEGNQTKSTSYYFANAERMAKEDSAGRLLFFNSDHLGSTNVITDSSGSLNERDTYYPFGEIRLDGTEKYLYTGKERDSLTGQYYFGARYYTTNMMHFNQADTIVQDGSSPKSFNRYAYVNNSPISNFDPDGHGTVYVLDKATGVKGAGHVALMVAKDGKLYYFFFFFDDRFISAKITRLTYAGTDIDEAMKYVNNELGEKYSGYARIDASDKRIDRVFAYADSPFRRFGFYLGLQANCEDYVRDSLNSGGIETPHTVYPNNFYSQTVGDGVSLKPIPQGVNPDTALGHYQQAVRELNQ